MSLPIPCAVPRTEAAFTCAAVVVGAFQAQRSQDALEGLTTPVAIARHLPACASNCGPTVVGVIRVEPLFDRTGRNTQRFPPRGSLDGLQIPVVYGSRANKPLDFRQDLGFERPFEAPFFAASGEAALSAIPSWASHKRSFASTNS